MSLSNQAGLHCQYLGDTSPELVKFRPHLLEPSRDVVEPFLAQMSSSPQTRRTFANYDALLNQRVSVQTFLHIGAAHTCPMSSKFVEIGPNSADIGPHLVDSGPRLADISRGPSILGRIGSDLT